MAFRLLALAAASSLVFIGCDEKPPLPPAAPTTTSVTATSAATPSAAVATAPRSRITLDAIPLSMEVPTGWLLQPGANGALVLHGRLPTGELDVLLMTQPAIKADALALMVKQITKPDAADGKTKTEVVQRDGMTIIQTTAPQTPPGAATTDPDLVPMSWTVQCIVAGDKLDLPVYEMTIVGLSQAMYDKDQKFIRELLSTLRYEQSAVQPAAK